LVVLERRWIEINPSAIDALASRQHGHESVPLENVGLFLESFSEARSTAAAARHAFLLARPCARKIGKPSDMSAKCGLKRHIRTFCKIVTKPERRCLWRWAYTSHVAIACCLDDAHRSTRIRTGRAARWLERRHTIPTLA